MKDPLFLDSVYLHEYVGKDYGTIFLDNKLAFTVGCRYKVSNFDYIAQLG